MAELGVGIIGGGYMGKAHAVAMNAVAAVFDTALKPRLEMVCATSLASAQKYRDSYGFNRATDDWQVLVSDPAIEAVIIAAPQSTHHDIALKAFERGKHVLCEKPLGASVAQAEAMTLAAEQSGRTHMVGFNYIRTPASQFARQLIAEGVIGDLIWFRGEHTEDFLADPSISGSWRTEGRAMGTMGDLAPHMINAALALAGPMTALSAHIETVYANRPDATGKYRVPVTNDDQAQMMCRFANGATGHLFFSRVQHGRKMGYAYEITGTKGAIRFDQEDQNVLWLYEGSASARFSGFRKILTGPEHPDYLQFCQGPGHGTGYQDQIIIEAKDFLKAIETGEAIWPTFRDGLEVARIVDAAWKSHDTGQWIEMGTATGQAV